MPKQKKKYVRIIQVANPGGMHGGGLVQCLMFDLGKKNRPEVVPIRGLQQFLDEFEVAVQLPDGSTRSFTEAEPPSVKTISRWLLEANPAYQALCAQERALAVAPSSAVRAYVRSLWHHRAAALTQ